jgi:hypothetical protein
MRWSRWITPIHEKKRFDTLFFVHILPLHQNTDINVDGKEIVDYQWMSPKEALSAFEKKGKFTSVHWSEIALYPPQFCTLTEMSQWNLLQLQQEIHRRASLSVMTITPELINPRLLKLTGFHHPHPYLNVEFKAEKGITFIEWASKL